MTHSPPVPPANQAPYPPVEPPHAAKATKITPPAPEKAKRVTPATGSVLPVALLVGAAFAAVAGFAIWSARDTTGDRG